MEGSNQRTRGAIRGGGEQSEANGSNQRQREAMRGKGERSHNQPDRCEEKQSEEEGSDLRWRRVVRGGGEQSEAEGSNQRWREAIRGGGSSQRWRGAVRGGWERSEVEGSRQWPEVYDLCHTFLHVARVKKPAAMRECENRSGLCQADHILACRGPRAAGPPAWPRARLSARVTVPLVVKPRQ